MKQMVWHAVLVAVAAAGIIGACAEGSTGVETGTGEGGDDSATSGPGTSGPATSGSATSGMATSGTMGQGGTTGGCGPCDLNATCDMVNNICVCNPGYTGDGMTCSDIDECAMDPTICGTGGVCTNEPGSYSCMCGPGYQDQGGQCVDIDECAMGGGGCATGCTCINEVGSPPTCDCMLTQSLSQSIVSANSVSCNNMTTHTDNSYYRVFDLGALGIDGAFSVSQVDMGIELATSNSSTQSVVIKLYQLNGAFTLANLLPITNSSLSVANNTQSTVVTFPVSGMVPALSKLVVEFFAPNGSAGGNLLFVGSNTNGETAPGYMRAADCGINVPTTTAGIGYPNMHIVMNVHGTYKKP